MNRPPPLPGHRFKVSVYVRSDRRWPLWVRITDRLTGRVVREALEGLTVRQKARAYARALERQNQLNSVTSADLKPVDWKTACAEFLDLMAAERRPATAYLYRQVLKRFGEFCTETIARRRDTFFLSEITVVAARQYITWRKQRNWKRDQAGAENSTVNKHLRMLRAAWAWWKKTGYVQANPWAELSPLAEMKRHRRRLSIEERDRLLAVAGEFGIRFETALALALESGMRLGEISHVTWHHLDVDGRELLITREAGFTPKNHAEGVLRFSPATAMLLRDLYQNQIGALIRATEVDGNTAREMLAGQGVFGYPMKSGANKLEREFNATLRRACARAGIATITAHGLRRTAARLAIDAGAAPDDVRSLLRHASYQTTRTYIGDNQADGASRAFEALTKVQTHPGRTKADAPDLEAAGDVDATP